MPDISPREIPLVLIVDDDLTMRLLTRAALEGAGFEVKEALDGLQALSLFAQCRPDVVLLDVLMPKMDGFAVCIRLRALPGGEHTPIIMVTGLEDIDSIKRAQEVGATDFITKPINWTILSHRVRYMLNATQAFQARQKLEEELHQAQKMEALGRLAGGVAHDFNNILAAITGYCDLLLEKLGAQESLSKEVEEIRLAAERAAYLTRQLLAFSRKQVIKPRVLNLNTIVGHLDHMLRRVIGGDIDLVFSPAPELAPLTADPGQMEQVIMNLVLNARDAMPQGGRITVATANVELDETYTRHRAEVTPGPYVRLAVQDTGVGLDPAIQGRIFEPFFTTKEPGKGTGLGLSIVHGIVKQSGGHITVDSEPGRGATFFIYLPQAVGGEDDLKSPPISPPAVEGSETLLLVEDDDMVRRVVQRLLEKHGYTVLAAGGGEEAVRLSEQYAGPIQLLLTDAMMPGLNGREVADRLQARRPEMKVLFMSGHTETALLSQGEASGEFAFIQKPFKHDTLARRVREVLDAPGRGE